MPVPKKNHDRSFGNVLDFFVVLSVDWSVGWFHSWLSAGHTLVSLLVHWSFIQYLHRHYKLLHICRSYYNLLNHMYKASLHAPFIFHATFTWGFHLDFFSTCFVTLVSPGSKQDLFHLIFTTTSVSFCFISSTTLPLPSPSSPLLPSSPSSSQVMTASRAAGIGPEIRRDAQYPNAANMPGRMVRCPPSLRERTLPSSVDSPACKGPLLVYFWRKTERPKC